MRLVKFDQELQLVFAEVYPPNIPDSQGHIMSRETIRKAAHNFLANMRTKRINHEHERMDVDAVVVESFIARDEDLDFIPGSWVVGVHIADPVLWEGVKTGEINGFSLEGIGVQETRIIELDIPEELTIETAPAQDGHRHSAILRFNDNGDLVDGRTQVHKDGHFHIITGGTITGPSSVDGDNHTHRFSFLEHLLNNVT